MRTVLKLISRNALMCKIDLKDASFSVPIHRNHRKFLRFYVKGNLFEFTYLPFGLSTSPHSFTKVMKPVMSHLRSKGFISSIFLDNILCIASSTEECLSQAIETTAFLSSLGFIINEQKNCFILSNRTEYLGFIVDSEKFCLKIPESKKVTISNLLSSLQSGTSCSITTFSRLIGSLISICPATAYGTLYTNELERVKQSNFIINEGDFDQLMTIARSLQSDLD
uniref:TY3B-I_3 protein n=1 Tax=Fopius arisanus TaxID=64838 RepID=A0A0C9RF32_9HYME